MDETYIKVAGQWKYLYGAVDPQGDTVDFLITAKRDKTAARRFPEQAIDLHEVQEKITIDKSGANIAAIKSVNDDACRDIELRQSKYLNNIVERYHRAVKRVTGPMLGFKSFWGARILTGGIETVYVINNGQMSCSARPTVSVADQFCSLGV